MTLELADIQGDILRAYGNAFAHTHYAFLSVPDAERGRAWLRGQVARVTTAEPWSPGEKPPTTLNLAVTRAGLDALGVSAALVDSFSSEFRAGMAARADLLGDTGPSAPTEWEAGLGRGTAHLLATINAQAGDQLTAARGELLEAAREEGLEVIHERGAQLLEGAREHFGYADGFSQPAIEGVSDDKRNGGGVPDADGAWRALAPGEFVLGYEDEDSRVDPQGRLPRAPADPLGRNGTYMAWRKLHQDVALFRRTLRDAARLYEHGDEEMLAAKVVGRWRNGTPLVTSPHAPDPSFAADAPGANDFRYAAEDPGGRRCPIGSHIRRSNPRDSLGWEGRLSFRHRIIRRGMPYGLPLREGVLEDDGKPRGLVFVCFNASLSRQFEAVQVQWLNDGNIFHLGRDRDFIMGDPSGGGKMTIEGDPPFFLSPQRAFVITRGGEYLFVPGITALAAIADGATG